MPRVTLDNAYGIEWIESQIARILSTQLETADVSWNDRGITMVSAQLEKTIAKLEQQGLFPPPGWERNSQGQIVQCRE